MSCIMWTGVDLLKGSVPYIICDQFAKIFLPFASMHDVLNLLMVYLYSAENNSFLQWFKSSLTGVQKSRLRLSNPEVVLHGSCLLCSSHYLDKLWAVKFVTRIRPSAFLSYLQRHGWWIVSIPSQIGFNKVLTLLAFIGHASTHTLYFHCPPFVPSLSSHIYPLLFNTVSCLFEPVSF